LAAARTWTQEDCKHRFCRWQNAPYSQQKVNETIAKLKRDGRFQNVKVEVIPETNGLRVLFVLQPAFYFGVFQFPEAVNSFSYTQLLQAANYSRKSPIRENA